MVVSGTGDMQMDVLLSKLKNRFSVEAELSIPRVGLPGEDPQEGGGPGPLQEAVRRSRPVRRRRRSASSLASRKSWSSAEEVLGGAVPKNYFPAVEKGSARGRPARCSGWLSP